MPPFFLGIYHDNDRLSFERAVRVMSLINATFSKNLGGDRFMPQCIAVDRTARLYDTTKHIPHFDAVLMASQCLWDAHIPSFIPPQYQRLIPALIVSYSAAENVENERDAIEQTMPRSIVLTPQTSVMDIARYCAVIQEWREDWDTLRQQMPPLPTTMPSAIRNYRMRRTPDTTPAPVIDIRVLRERRAAQHRTDGLNNG
ncbi:MAG: hypothetical protein KGI37_07005 [Alphaproteobacteria bacterium]|nr:hypothetical protein [Alphaproteobacteria bacterium]